jgi:hypothetical protein
MLGVPPLGDSRTARREGVSLLQKNPRTSSELSEPALTLAWIVCHAFPTPECDSILGRADGKQPFCRGGGKSV